MPILINQPDPTLLAALTTEPSVRELANRSQNVYTTKLRYSLDRRSLVGRLQGFPMSLAVARNALSDLYPTGINVIVDNSQTGGIGGGVGQARMLF